MSITLMNISTRLSCSTPAWLVVTESPGMVIKLPFDVLYANAKLLERGIVGCPKLAIPRRTLFILNAPAQTVV